MQRIVIIGAGQAGLSCAARLRAEGFAGEIAMVGDEADPPYQRPPLSKAYLLGKLAADRLWLRPQEWYVQQQIALHLSTCAVAIERGAQQVLLQDGRRLPYDALVLATGARARALPTSLQRGLAGVFTLRNRTDIEAMRPALEQAADVVVIGGGYIGLEMAAVARGLGRRVALVEQAPTLLGRVACPQTADTVASLHLSQGVTLHLGCGLQRLIGTDHVSAAELDSGLQLAADLVIAGIGAIPRTELAEAAGLAVANGILVDATGQSSDPHVYAAGDCATYQLPDGNIRLESVGNAVDTGELVARTLLGQRSGYQMRPWFWSDQYDLKLQMAGRGMPGDRILVRDVPGEGRSHWYFRAGRLVAVDALNAPRAYQAGRRMVFEGLTPDPGDITDTGKSLKDILTALPNPQ